MAGTSNADPLHRLTVDASPPPIPKDMQGSDNSVPLSPQWLLPKLVDTKLGLAAGEKRTDPLKSLGNVEDLNVTEKKKDVFRPSFYDTEKIRRDCWADEEREANPAMRRDLRKEVEELGDTRKLERWSNSSSRYSSEARHFPSERWSGSGSRENAYEPRRESKWNPRWGPDDKETENWRDKCLGKDGELSHYKGAHHQTIHAKDTKNQGKDTDKEGEHYSRAWRSSPAVNRGRGETSPYLPSTTNKSASMFGYGRGKGDTGAPVLSVDRPSVGLGTSNASGGSAHQFPLGIATDRSNGSHRNPPGLRYSRMKLFDIYRMTDLKGYGKTFEGFQDFPSLIQADHLVPLAFIAPISEELVIMDAIEKGELLSSGVPQASIDSSSGKNHIDSGLLPLTKSGIGEDAPHVVTSYRDQRTNHGKDRSFYVDSDVYDKCSRVLDSKVPSSESLGRYQEVTLTSEEIKLEATPNSTHDSSREGNKLEKTIPWRSPSVGGWSLSSWDLTKDESGSSNMGWLNKQEEMWIEPSRCASSSSHIGGDPQCQNPANLQSNMWIESQIKRQPSKTVEQDQGDPFTLREKLKDRKLQQYLSPEHLSLFYKDPQGQIQGPFSGSNLIEWFDAGYFGINLLVRLASAPADTPFSMLGDVIPQLRTRVRPPPGFGSSRQNDIVEVSNRGKVGGAVGAHLSISDLDLVKNGQILGIESKVEAENRFLESLMAARINNSLSESNLLSEGMQGYNGLAGSRPSLEVDNLSDMKYLFHKMPLEQQSLLTPYLPGSDYPAILSKADSFREIPVPPKTLPQIGEIPHQHVDLLSILQSATNKTPPPPVNSALPVWPNFSEVQTTNITHGSIDIMKDASGLHSDQQSSQTRFGTPPNKLQTQFQPSLSNQTPFFGFSSGTIPPEKSVALEFSHDAQMANLLRQQYMLNQHVHSQVPHPAHLNQMELLLLLQRQKLEQQQQQQYQLLSHAFSGHHLRNSYDEQSFGLLNTEAVDAGAAMKSHIQQMHEVAQSNHSINVLDSNESYVSVGLSNLNMRGAQDAVSSRGIEHSALNLPNQVIDHKSHSIETDTSLLNVGPTQTTFSDEMVSIPNNLSAVSLGLPQINENVTIASDAVNDLISSEKGEVGLGVEPFVSDMVDCWKVSLSAISNQARGETLVSKVLDDTVSKVLDDAELREVKKTSEKKSRKHKNSHSLKIAPGQKAKHFEDGVAEKDVPMEETKPINKPTFDPLMESLDSHGAHMSSEVALDNKSKVDEAKAREVEFVRPSSNNLAWKPAPGQKVKSLLEIQVEEQNRAQIQSFATDSIPKNMPANVSITSEQKYAVDTVQCDSRSQSVSENSEKCENPSKLRNRSQLHDVFSEEILPEVSGGNSEEKGTYLPPLSVQNEAAVDHDFIEAKDTRKGRKKAAKNKGVTSKFLLQSNSAGLSPSMSITEETIAPLQPQQEKELLPSPPPAPSLGDFVFWKGDHANTIPPPVWSTDSVKVQKPAFLKDIFKEQDKNTKSGQQQIPIQIPNKVQATKVSGGGSSLGQVSGSTPSKVLLASSIKTNSIALGQQKKEMEDDLFWGPLSQAKQGTRLDYPSHANPISEKLKGGTPVKIAYGEGSSKNALSTKLAEHSTVTSSPSIKQSNSKGKKDSESKNSEATDFRDWCEAEWLRLTGTNDTSFLEFCLKQTTLEAEALLRENVSSLDRANEFIDKFVNYKKFLPSEIIETTFQGSGSNKVSKNADAEADDGADGSSRGKKKGKKGKKVSPALLGFNVVSNRIMMGEIQTIED